MPDTNLTFTHCQATHLTQFAGGFVALPANIDFSNAFAKADFMQNLTIYITIIVLSCLYVVLAIIMRYFDYQDNQKLGITNLANPRHEFMYEITVFTGSRFDAETESNVHMVLTGDESETKIVQLKDEKRKVFMRGAVDTFVISSSKYIYLLTILKLK